jgi:hypothetical protein
MERAYFKGSSKSKGLFDLILRLQKLEMRGDLIIHLIWVAGMRMIEKGMDGISWGDLNNGVMSGQCMLSFIPLDTRVDQCAPALVDWVMSASGRNWKVLNPRE